MRRLDARAWNRGSVSKRFTSSRQGMPFFSACHATRLSAAQDTPRRGEQRMPRTVLISVCRASSFITSYSPGVAMAALTTRDSMSSDPAQSGFSFELEGAAVCVGSSERN